MARTKTTSRAHSQSPPHTAEDQPSDHSPLNKTPVYTVLPDVVIPLFEPPKPKSSKKSIPKPKPKATRRSTRMKKSSSTPTTSHVDLISDNEKEEEEMMNEASDEDPSLKNEMLLTKQRKLRKNSLIKEKESIKKKQTLKKLEKLFFKWLKLLRRFTKGERRLLRKLLRS
jgi:hypothetical protein